MDSAPQRLLPAALAAPQPRAARRERQSRRTYPVGTLPGLTCLAVAALTPTLLVQTMRSRIDHEWAARPVEEAA
jgi:hypothetical protein